MIIEIDRTTLALKIFEVLATQLRSARVDGPVRMTHRGLESMKLGIRFATVGDINEPCTIEETRQILAAMANNVAQLVMLGELEACPTCEGTGDGLNGPCTTCRGHGDTRSL